MALPKEVGIGTNFYIRGDVKAQVALHSGFQECDEQPALRYIMRRGNDALANEFLELLLVGVLFLQGEEGYRRSLNAMVMDQVLAGRNIIA